METVLGSGQDHRLIRTNGGDNVKQTCPDCGSVMLWDEEIGVWYCCYCDKGVIP
jgi:ribosomal protein L37AE/L43A